MEFIYRPVSGDRVFAEKPVPDICFLVWGNGCRHIVGGQRLDYSTAVPRAWWRDMAKKTAEVVIKRFGGIAWDDQGLVSLVVPSRFAVTAARTMQGMGGEMVAADERVEFEPSIPRDPGKNERALFGAGLIDLEFDERGLPFFRERWIDRSVMKPLQAPRLKKGEEKTTITFKREMDGVIIISDVTAPAEWGRPTSSIPFVEDPKPDELVIYKALAFCEEPGCNCDDTYGRLLYEGIDLAVAELARRECPEGYRFAIEKISRPKSPA